MPLNETIAQLYEDLGRARGAQLGTIGQTISVIPQQMQQQRFQALQQQDMQGQIAERNARAAEMQRTQAVAAAGEAAMRANIDPTTGKVNHEAAADAWERSGLPGAATAVQGYRESLLKTQQTSQALEEGRQKIQQGQQQMQQAAVNHLGELGAAGLSKLQTSSPVEARDYTMGLVANAAAHQLIQPEDAHNFLMQTAQAGPDQLSQLFQSAVDGAPAVKTRLTEEALKKAQATQANAAAQKDLAGDPVAAQRELETARHNKEMERIQGLQVGREGAANAESARHNKAMEAANNPLAALTGGGTGAPTSAAVAEGAHGDDFLKTLPPTVASEVKAYAEGRRPFPSGFALKSPYFQSLIQMVGQYDPTFDAVNYNSRAKTRQDFTSGASSKNINALNTVTQHLSLLSDAADSLKNTSLPSWNTVSNLVSKATGNPTVTNFNTTKKAVVDELTRAWRQAGGSESDIRSWSDALDASGSPEQLHGTISQIGKLIEGKLSALESQYHQGMGTTDTTGMQVVTPQARQTLDKLEQRASGGAASSGDWKIVGSRDAK